MKGFCICLGCKRIPWTFDKSFLTDIDPLFDGGLSIRCHNLLLRASCLTIKHRLVAPFNYSQLNRYHTALLLAQYTDELCSAPLSSHSRTSNFKYYEPHPKFWSTSLNSYTSAKHHIWTVHQENVSTSTSVSGSLRCLTAGLRSLHANTDPNIITYDPLVSKNECGNPRPSCRAVQEARVAIMSAPRAILCRSSLRGRVKDGG